MESHATFAPHYRKQSRPARSTPGPQHRCSFVAGHTRTARPPLPRCAASAMPPARCLPCFGGGGDDAELRAAAAASRVALLVAADAPAALPASFASLALERRDSVQSQWAAGAAGVNGGRLARRITGTAAPERAERLRRAFSLAAALLPAASRVAPPQQRGTPAALLDARLASLRLRRAQCIGDGNCLFRALAAAIFGDQARHAAVRSAVVAQLRTAAGAAAFAPLFASAADYALYCADMAASGTWGDELGLAAAAEAFSVEVHVIQDTEQHWHVAYAPTHRRADGRTLRAFVAYTAPVHYDAIVPADDVP